MIESLKKYIIKNKRRKFIYIALFLSITLLIGYKVNFSFSRLYRGIPSMMDLFKRMLNPN